MKKRGSQAAEQKLQKQVKQLLYYSLQSIQSIQYIYSIKSIYIPLYSFAFALVAALRALMTQLSKALDFNCCSSRELTASIASFPPDTRRLISSMITLRQRSSNASTNSCPPRPIVHSLHRSGIVVMPRDSWYIGGSGASISIGVGAGIGPQEGAPLGRRGGGRGRGIEQSGNCSQTQTLRLLGVKVRLKAPLQKSLMTFSSASTLPSMRRMEELLPSRPV